MSVDSCYPPSVFYIGLQRSGSTFLRNYFYAHPQIHCTREGVLLQLDACDPQARSAAEIRNAYHGRFPHDPQTPVRMDMYEALAMGYTMPGVSGWSPTVALSPGRTFLDGGMRPDRVGLCQRIALVADRPRIILTIRNQLEWLSSNYRYMLAHLPKEKSRFLDFMDTLEGKLVAYTGLHDLAIEEYYRQFGTINVMVLPLERTASDLEGTLRRVCSFLGVDYIPYETGGNFRNAGPVYQEGQLPFQQAGLHDGRSHGLLGMTEEDVRFVRSFYAASNFRLSTIMNEDLSVHGYTC